MGDPKKANLLPRPNSARAKLRKGTGLVPYQFPASAEMAAAAAKRFLSRTCGTMQAALQTFDPSGDGRFSREEWEDGLKLLDFLPSHDVQEIFNVLDKRQHHMLTLSDLLDYCKGIPIDTGIPPLGFRGQASEIFQEVLNEQLLSVAKDALVEIICADLMAPRGPISGLPDVDAWLKEKGWDPSKIQTGKTSPTSGDAASRKATPGTPGSQSGKTKKTLTGTGDVSQSEKIKKPITDTGDEGDAKSEDGESSEEEDPETDPEIHDQGSKVAGQLSEKDKADAKAFFQMVVKLRSQLGREPKRSEVVKGKLKAEEISHPTKRQVKDVCKDWKRLEKRVQKALRAASKIQLGREPPSEEIVAAKFKDYGGGHDPSQQEVKQEVKNVKKVDKSIEAGILLRLRRKLKEQLGREPTEEELAKFKVQQSLGREPTPTELKKETKKIVKIETKKTGGNKSANVVNRMLQAQVDIDPLKLIEEAKRRGQKDGGVGKWQQAQDIGRRQTVKKKGMYSNAKPGRFPGFGFVDDRESDDGTLPDEKMLPFVPRPTSEICKTYSHIYKLLGDPQVQKLRGVQKRSLHVKMPGLASAESEDGQDLPKAEEKATLSASGKSKSSPNLARPASGGSGVSLPPLVTSAPSKKPLVHGTAKPKAADGMGGYPGGH